MAEIQDTPVNNPGWLSGVLSRLGIPFLPTFFYRNIVVPVSLVDSGVSLTVSAPLFGTPASAGETVAPAANTRLADTGQLVAGNWSLLVIIGTNQGQGTAFRLRRRNAADNADIWSSYINMPPNTLNFSLTGRFSVSANERFVVENIGAGQAAQTYQASIFSVAG